MHCSWSWLALGVQLLLHCCLTPVPPRRGVHNANSQRADPKGMTRALGCGRERRWRAAGKRCNNSGGWVCGAGCGPCAAARLCVGMARGCREAEKRRTRAVAAVGASSPRPRARGNPLCVRHTARRTFVGCAARRGWERGARRGGSPHATRRGRRWTRSSCVRSPGWRGERALEPRDARQAQPQVCGRGHYQRIKIEQLVFQSQARRKAGRGAGGVRLDRGPSPSRSASAARRARARSKKKEKKGGRPKGTDSRGGAPDARPKTHALQNDTPRPEPAPAGMLQGLPIAAERRAVGWGNGEGAGEGVATSTAAFPLCGRSWAARSGLCRPPPGYFSTFPG